MERRMKSVNIIKGRINKIEGPGGGYTQYSDFDAATNQPKTVTHYHGTDASSNTILHSIFYTYNPSGMPLTITDARTKTTTFEYYVNNTDLKKVIKPGLLPRDYIEFTYNGNTHDIATITDRMGVTTEFGYDNSTGQLEMITQAQGTAIQAVTELTYDPAAKTLMNVKRNGNVLTSFTYDTVGRVQTQTDSKGITLSYDYDNLDRLTTRLKLKNVLHLR